VSKAEPQKTEPGAPGKLETLVASRIHAEGQMAYVMNLSEMLARDRDALSRRLGEIDAEIARLREGEK
jgi:hypothetical protein